MGLRRRSCTSLSFFVAGLPPWRWSAVRSLVSSRRASRRLLAQRCLCTMPRRRAHRRRSAAAERDAHSVRNTSERTAPDDLPLAGVSDNARPAPAATTTPSSSLSSSSPPIDVGDTSEDETDAPCAGFTVSETAAPTPTRIDRVLSAHFSEPSRVYFQYLIAQSAVQVNEQVVQRKSQRVRAGSHIAVRFLMPPHGHTDDLLPEDIPLDVLHEDEHLLVINKAPDMVVHPAPGKWSGTLVNALLFRFQRATVPTSTADRAAASVPSPADGSLFDKLAEGVTRPGIVHRLDKGTSGVMVVAKTDRALQRLQRAFAERRVRKTYLAVLGGMPKQAGAGRHWHTVELPIGRHPVRRVEMTPMEVARGGRTATTHFEVLAACATLNVAVARVHLETGRTHQIRVHARHGLHAPVLGDEAYGLAVHNQRYSGMARRPLLHAWQLELTHPISGQRMHFEAPVPEDVRAFMERLQVALEDVSRKAVDAATSE
ncbi:hypothetical protein CDCA_CDCA10G3005 [Cyanidium caldarium]|uniref:Pseudouridine synthase n=1 Tax=Cyanidium caldarium TaxID=2771 RepID=A0AAV9IY06_CYACA|nr:hypothetical protein CDCA_CDCA10G3005 [Cyanidium caldarium]